MCEIVLQLSTRVNVLIHVCGFSAVVFFFLLLNVLIRNYEEDVVENEVAAPQVCLKTV